MNTHMYLFRDCHVALNVRYAIRPMDAIDVNRSGRYVLAMQNHVTGLRVTSDGSMNIKTHRLFRDRKISSKELYNMPLEAVFEIFETQDVPERVVSGPSESRYPTSASQLSSSTCWSTILIQLDASRAIVGYLPAFRLQYASVACN